MTLGAHKLAGRKRRLLRHARPWALLGLTIGSASCVPAAIAEAPPVSLASAPAPRAAPVAAPTLRPRLAAGIPTPVALTGRTAIDRLRAEDCLAQAIYYEARSESEDGQRAVAQVVINRVRHPAWPNSVCGVVYQGPLRAGGGCQFTFTCDGSLAEAPRGPAWARARLLAAEALAGRTYAPIGLSTHYHTLAVSPSWAPRLAVAGVIGAHIFYRMPGAGGLAAAFAQPYGGREPMPRPAMTLFRPAGAPPRLTTLDLPLALLPANRPVQAVRSDIPQETRWTATNLPESTIRDEYRQSGQWRADAPAAITGAR